MKIDFTPTIKDALEQALNKISKQNKTVNYYPIAILIDEAAFFEWVKNR